MTPLTPRRYCSRLALLAVLLLVVVVLSPGIGSQSGEIGLGAAWRAYLHPERDPVAYQIAFRLRLARTLLALEAGVTLALCGAVFQVLFRNSLATPYTLGIASGAALGALAAIQFGFQLAVGGVSTVTLCAFAGAMAVLVVIVLFGRSARRLTVNELLLAGVTMGLFCSAMMMLLTYLSNPRTTFEIIRWMMGSLDAIGDLETAYTLPILAPAWIILLLHARSLNQYALGDEMAASRGVDVPRLQIVCILAASLAAATVVAICGPIGFVGLVVPHMTALVVGRDCRILLPATALLGGVFLAVCDWLSQLTMVWAAAVTGQPIGGAILPIGVVTAVLGVPIFLILLRRNPV